MAHMDRVEVLDMPERYSITKAKNGFILEEYSKKGSSMSYVYEDVDELLSDLREDLAGGEEKKKDGEDMSEHKKKAKTMSDKLMAMEGEDEE